MVVLLTVSRSLETFLAWKPWTMPVPGLSSLLGLCLRFFLPDSPFRCRRVCVPRSLPSLDTGS
jgi:hypothetical protein